MSAGGRCEHVALSGDTGGAGTSFRCVMTGKMKTLLRRWVNSRSARILTQIHLQIYDRSSFISQKASEQCRRDAYRNISRETEAGRNADDYLTINRIGLMRNCAFLEFTAS